MLLSPDAQNLVLQAQLFSTLFMTGLIWFVQVVHYPLLVRVGEAAFTNYARQHQYLTGWVVGPMMLVELLSAMLLFFTTWQERFGSYFWTNLILLYFTWAVTFALLVPLHRRLTREYSPVLVKRLIMRNWLRTIIWSVRAILLVRFLG